MYYSAKGFSTMFMKDLYKVSHPDQYPENTTRIVSNFTPRKARDFGGSVFFGLDYFLREYLDKEAGSIWGGSSNYNDWITALFGRPSVKMQEFLDTVSDKKVGETIIPLAIYALPEGSFVPSGVPALVVYNTDSRFPWLVNTIETLLSATLWGPCTVATVARAYLGILEAFSDETCDNGDHIPYQLHDFSFRGMFGYEAALLSGLAHLEYFKGTDNFPAIMWKLLRNDAPAPYHAFSHPLCELVVNEAGEFTEFAKSCLPEALHHIGGSIPATEHSVMCAYGRDNELETFRHLITNVYPSGPVSIVADTWDFWNVIENFLPILKDEIMAREGKVVIRPDSGDPVKIICGYDTTDMMSALKPRIFAPEKGLIQMLWEIFGGTVNAKGYKVLDPHIGAIYGDGITLERARSILSKLEKQGFASSNIVFGVGSYSYQYNTRDTLGWAMKSTYAEIGGVPTALFKDPKTDDGTKRSAKGLTKVIKDQHGQFKLVENVTWEEFHQPDNELKLQYFKGQIIADLPDYVPAHYSDEIIPTDFVRVAPQTEGECA